MSIHRLANIQWMVEVRGERLGPMSTQQIVHKLMRKEMKVVHRVSETTEGWVAICNEPIFEKYILHLIEQVSHNVSEGSVGKVEEPIRDTDDDATVVSSDLGELSGIHNLSAIKQGLSEQLSHAKELQQASTNLTLLRHLLSEIRIKRKVVIVANERGRADEEELHPDDMDEYVITPMNLKDYLNLGSAKMVYSVLIVGTLIFLGLKWKENKTSEFDLLETHPKTESAATSAPAPGGGAAQQALPAPSGGASVSGMNESELVDLTDQMMGDKTQGDKWTLLDSARGKINVLSNNSGSSSTPGKQEAFEALNSKAYEHLLSGEIDQAENLLLRSLALGATEQSSAFVLLLETALLFSQARPGAESQARMREVANLAARFRGMNKRSNSKLYIVEMAAYHKLGNIRMVEAKVNEFLMIHPRGEKEDVGVGYRQKTSWTGMLPHCIQIYGADNSNPRFSAMLAGCLVRTPSSSKAEPYIYYAHKKMPEDGVIKDLLGWVYYDMGSYEKAKKILWDTNVPSFKVSNFQTFSRIEFCKTQGSDPFCNGRGTASDR